MKSIGTESSFIFFTLDPYVEIFELVFALVVFSWKAPIFVGNVNFRLRYSFQPQTNDITMNLKTIILLCVIVLFIPACILADSSITRATLSLTKQQKIKNDLDEYRHSLQVKFEQLALQKEKLEQELIKITSIENKLFNPFKAIDQQEEMSDKLNMCSACNSGVGAIVRTFGCGSFLISYKSCLPLVSTLVGAAVCGATVYTAKQTIVKACERYSDINKVVSSVSNYICREKLDFC